jgi:hypothetical protein
MSRVRNSIATQDSANALAAKVSEWLGNTDPTDIWASCHTCRHSDPDTAMCGLYRRVPPVAVITGSTECPGYVDGEDIPF